MVLNLKEDLVKFKETCPYTNKYGIRDYKKKILIPIHKVSIGRWIFKGKKFNKLSDINWRYC